MTLRQFAARCDRLREKEQREDLRVGIMCSVTANFSMGKDPKRRALTPRDFISTLPEPEASAASPEETVGLLLAWAGAHNGVAASQHN